MKIRLVEPQPAGINVYDFVRLPRLGLPLIGRLLQERGHDVRIYVEILAPIDWRDLETADLVGFSTTTSTSPAAYAMAEQVRQAGIPTVIGGSHVSFLPDEGLDHCDYVVRGEGQVTILELVEALQRGSGFDKILGLSFHDSQGRKIHNAPRLPCTPEEFVALPAPDLTLIEGYERISPLPIMTQWGCPFNCDFCSVILMFGRQVRSRRIEDVLAELEEHQPQSVFFYDDNFVVDKRRTKRLLRAMIERGLTPRWGAQMRADAVYKNKRTGELDHELLSLMKEAGGFTVYCGFESVNPATLQAYKKKQSVKNIEDSIKAFHAYGFHIHGMFVLGSDEDDVKTIHQTADFAIRKGIDTVQLMILTPCPGTPFFARVEDEGRILSYDWRLYDGQHVLMQPAKMTPYELQMEAYKANMRFYSNWQFAKLLIINALKSLPYLAWLAIREYKLSLQLPRIALLSLIPGKRGQVLNILQEKLSQHGREFLERKFAGAALRKVGHDLVQKWAHQAYSTAHIARLKSILPKGGRKSTTTHIRC